MDRVLAGRRRSNRIRYNTSFSKYTNNEETAIDLTLDSDAEGALMDVSTPDQCPIERTPERQLVKGDNAVNNQEGTNTSRSVMEKGIKLEKRGNTLKRITKLKLRLVLKANVGTSAKGNELGGRKTTENNSVHTKGKERNTTNSEDKEVEVGFTGFHYSTESVVMVDKFGYYHRDSTHPIAYFNDGNTLVKLDKFGTVYFISGNWEGCIKGQLMMLNVVDLHHHHHHRHLPASIAYALQNPYYDMSPSPSQVAGGLGTSGSGSVLSAYASFKAYIVAALVLVLVYSY